MQNVMNIISEVQIIPIKPREGLIAFASLILDGKIYLSSIGIFSKLDGSGYRLTYPTKKVGLSSLQIFHPINHELSSAIESAVLNKWKELETQ